MTLFLSLFFLKKSLLDQLKVIQRFLGSVPDAAFLSSFLFICLLFIYWNFPATLDSPGKQPRKKIDAKTYILVQARKPLPQCYVNNWFVGSVTKPGGGCFWSTPNEYFSILSAYKRTKNVFWVQQNVFFSPIWKAGFWIKAFLPLSSKKKKWKHR